MPCAAVGLYDVLVDILVPMAAAVLGGWITMWGVVRTIKHEQQNAHEQTLQAAKPWIFSLDTFEHRYNNNAASMIKMQGKTPAGSNCTLSFLLHNTDNGIGIIEKFVTENNEYLPGLGRIIEKNSTVEVIISLDTNETLENMYFIIRDIYGNRYKYKAYQTGQPAKGNHIEEIGLIE